MRVLPKFSRNELNIYRPKPNVNIIDGLDKNNMYYSLFSAEASLINVNDEDLLIDSDTHFTIYYIAGGWRIEYEEQVIVIKSLMFDDETFLLTFKR